MPQIKPVFTAIDHDSFVVAIRTLAAAIEGDGWRPTYIIGIGRGGLVPAIYLSHATGLPTLSVDYSSPAEEFAAALLVKLADRTRAGERLLFVDDINDTGGTINAVRDALARAGAITDHIRFATLIDNSVSAAHVDYRADTIDRTLTKDWFVFPWEALAPDAVLAADAAAVPERTA